MGFYRCFLASLFLVLSSFVTIIPIASAETTELHLLLNSQGSQSFEALLQQAQDLVKTSIEQEFTKNPQITEISILILGEHNGQVVPLLRSQVSRSQWQQDSRIHRWTRYFDNSEVLLGFHEPSGSPTTQPTPQIDSVPFKVRLREDPAFRDD